MAGSRGRFGWYAEASNQVFAVWVQRLGSPEIEKAKRGRAGTDGRTGPALKLERKGTTMHNGTTITKSYAMVSRVSGLDGDVQARLDEVNAAYAQVQSDLLRAETPERFAALSLLEFSLLSESVRLKSVTGEFAEVAL